MARFIEVPKIPGRTENCYLVRETSIDHIFVVTESVDGDPENLQYIVMTGGGQAFGVYETEAEACRAAAAFAKDLS